MGESIKVVCVLVLGVASIAAAVAWFDDQPNSVTWAIRIGGPILSLLAIAGFLRLHLRRDLAPDYLRRSAGNYFNRDGFCFAFAAPLARLSFGSRRP
jgi:hypothetical protein